MAYAVSIGAIKRAHLSTDPIKDYVSCGAHGSGLDGYSAKCAVAGLARRALRGVSTASARSNGRASARSARYATPDKPTSPKPYATTPEITADLCHSSASRDQTEKSLP